MNINIIKTFRQQAHKLYVHGEFVGTMNKWVDGAFGKVISWSAYDAGGYHLGYADTREGAWNLVIKARDERNRILASPY